MYVSCLKGVNSNFYELKLKDLNGIRWWGVLFALRNELDKTKVNIIRFSALALRTFAHKVR